MPSGKMRLLAESLGCVGLPGLHSPPNCSNISYLVTGNNNNSNSSSAPESDTQNRLDVIRYVSLVLFLTTFVFGTTGNSLTILVILRNKHMKTVATCFILNLAIADNLFMLSLPFMAHNSYVQRWVFGTALCKIMSAFYGINLYASVFTMVVMSIDRYLAIVHPISSINYRTNTNAGVVCVILWLICVVIMTPHWLYSDVKGPRCQVWWPKKNFLEYRAFWTNFELAVGFLAPITIMVFSYTLMLKHLVSNRSPLRGQGQVKSPIRKVTFMVLTVTVVFIVCWTPYRIFRHVTMQQTRRFMKGPVPPSEREQFMSSIFQTVAQALVFVSSCCNPFIYAISSRNFRRLYLAAVRCGPGRQSQLRSYGVTSANQRKHSSRVLRSITASWHLLLNVLSCRNRHLDITNERNAVSTTTSEVRCECIPLVRTEHSLKMAPVSPRVENHT